MAIQIITLKKSGTVISGIPLKDFYTPSSGAKVSLVEFIGHAAFDKNALVCVSWDDGGVSEEIIWSTKGDAFDKSMDEAVPDGDGVKKIEIILQNDTGADVVMTGKALIRVEI